LRLNTTRKEKKALAQIRIISHRLTYEMGRYKELEEEWEQGHVKCTDRETRRSSTINYYIMRHTTIAG